MEKECLVCKSNNVELHHVFYGKGNRKISEKYGFVVYLCVTHHRSQPDGIHGGNIKLDLELKMHFQKEYEKNHTREEFISLFGRNYLGITFDEYMRGR